MTHLTNVIEEEREAFHQLHQTNLVTKEMRDDFLTKAMHKSALAMLDELEWKGKGFHSGSEVVAWSDNKREEIRTKLLNNK